jgi:hypothetical protein
MVMSKKDQLFRIIAGLDKHFAADDCSQGAVENARVVVRS